MKIEVQKTSTKSRQNLEKNFNENEGRKPKRRRPLLNYALAYDICGRVKNDFEKWLRNNQCHPLHADFCLRQWLFREFKRRGLHYQPSQMTNYLQFIVRNPLFQKMLEFSKKFYDGCYRYVVNVKKSAHKYLVWLLSQLRMAGYRPHNEPAKTAANDGMLTVAEFFSAIGKTEDDPPPQRWGKNETADLSPEEEYALLLKAREQLRSLSSDPNNIFSKNALSAGC